MRWPLVVSQTPSVLASAKAASNLLSGAKNTRYLRGSGPRRPRLSRSPSSMDMIAMVCSNLPVDTSCSVSLSRPSVWPNILPSGENNTMDLGEFGTTPSGPIYVVLSVLSSQSPHKPTFAHHAWPSGLVNPQVVGLPSLTNRAVGEPSSLPVTASHLEIGKEETEKTCLPSGVNWMACSGNVQAEPVSIHLRAATSTNSSAWLLPLLLLAFRTRILPSGDHPALAMPLAE